MTYPPQQPGQGGWSEQPGGQPGYGPYGQPAYGQQAYPQGQPQTGPYPADPYQAGQYQGAGQYPPSGPQQVPGQAWGQQQPGYPFPGQPQPGYGYPYGGGQPPKKSKVGIILGAVGGGLVLVIGLIVVLTMTLGGSSAEATANEFVDKLNQKDFSGFNEMICEKNKASAEEIKDAAEQMDSGQFASMTVTVSLVGEVTETGNSATGTLRYERTNVPAELESILPAEQEAKMTMVKEGDWKICKLEPK